MRFYTGTSRQIGFCRSQDAEPWTIASTIATAKLRFATRAFGVRARTEL
jgi:hypothetical protein